MHFFRLMDFFLLASAAPAQIRGIVIGKPALTISTNYAGFIKLLKKYTVCNLWTFIF